uniref:Movement protein n=1 Tax=Datura ophiovirus TaxID=2983939 RepID=A0A9N6YK41_9VIRU|nr:TPA_asm: movement protein [Datura ophiovirus]
MDRQISRRGKEVCISRAHASDMLNEGFYNGKMNIIHLSSDMTEIDPSIEDVIMDYANVQKGIIKTAVSSITMKLKKEEHTKRLVIGGLKSLFNKVMPSRNFVRFEKVQILYIPLFQRNESDGQSGVITISLEDMGKENAGLDPVIEKVSFESHEMALIELSMDFFVAAKDLNNILVKMAVESIPIEGRSYGAINMFFFTHEEEIPIKTKKGVPKLIYLDPMMKPKDINQKTMFSKISSDVKKELEEKKKEFRRLETLRARERKKNCKKIEYIQESSSSDDSNINNIIDAGRKSISELMSVKQNNKNAMFTKSSRTFERPEGDKRLTCLDTASHTHLFFHGDAMPNKSIDYCGGVEKLMIEEGTILYKYHEREISMKNCGLFNEQCMKENIVSYSKLKEDGVINRMKSEDGTCYLMLDNKIILKCDENESGRMWIQDENYFVSKEFVSDFLNNYKLKYSHEFEGGLCYAVEAATEYYNNDKL